MTLPHTIQCRRKEPFSQICEIKTSNKSTLGTSTFAACSKKRDHIKYCHNIWLTWGRRASCPWLLEQKVPIPHWACKISSWITQGRTRWPMCKGKMKELRFLSAAAAEVRSRTLNHFSESSWSLKNQFALRDSNLAGCQMLARVLKLRVLWMKGLVLRETTSVPAEEQSGCQQCNY